LNGQQTFYTCQPQKGDEFVTHKRAQGVESGVVVLVDGSVQLIHLEVNINKVLRIYL
jgi:hypothetical protein